MRRARGTESAGPQDLGVRRPGGPVAGWRVRLAVGPERPRVTWLPGAVARGHPFAREAGGPILVRQRRAPGPRQPEAGAAAPAPLPRALRHRPSGQRSPDGDLEPRPRMGRCRSLRNLAPGPQRGVDRARRRALRRRPAGRPAGAGRRLRGLAAGRAGAVAGPGDRGLRGAHGAVARRGPARPRRLRRAAAAVPRSAARGGLPHLDAGAGRPRRADPSPEALRDPA